MNESVWRILEAIICIAELGSFHLFLKRNCEKKDRSFLYTGLVFVLCAGILCTKDYFAYPKLVWVVMCLMLYQVYGFFIFKEKLYMDMVYSGVYIVILGVCEALAYYHRRFKFNN